MFRHVLPNVMGPVLVLATIGLALAIIAEATLSFLGVGVPPTTPSLGTLIRVGNDFLFSGEWRITLFPALALVLLVLSVILLVEVGGASCRARVCQYVSISVVPVTLKKKHKTKLATVYLLTQTDMRSQIPLKP